MSRTVCVIGLGYVGLPVAVAFGKRYKTIGYDVNQKRLASLATGIDTNNDVSSADLTAAAIRYTSDPAAIAEADFIIVAVPTPVDDAHKPDLDPLIKASTTVGKHLRRGAIVVYESTVYPGVTEDVCVPVLERESGMRCGTDFFVGYSPERINPGDKEHTLERITKVVAGMDAATSAIVAEMYGSIIPAGVFAATSIRVAEAAKVIENTQRDLNIALMNELKMIFDRMSIDINDVLAAAGTKWNFLRFTPGLVGGHCIGVDPYYLAYQAERIGHHPEIILAGRRINDRMAHYEAHRVIERLVADGHKLTTVRILVLGATFKPDVNDLRNSKVQDVAHELARLGCTVAFHDPLIDSKTIFGRDNISPSEAKQRGFTHALLAVKHKRIIHEIDALRKQFTVLELFR